ncbi:MAG: hypothetical protein HP043_03300 [Dialister sp.]|nr:hypothetical protein [Dialister sp.]
MFSSIAYADVLADEYLLIRRASIIYSVNPDNLKVNLILENAFDFQLGREGTFWFKDNNGQLYTGIIDDKSGEMQAGIQKIGETGFLPYERFIVSADGKLLVSYLYNNKTENSILKVKELNSADQNDILKVSIPGEIKCPSVSPDSSKIAFYLRESDHFEFCLAIWNIKTRKLDKISPISKWTAMSPIRTWAPQWNDSGTYLVFEGRFTSNYKQMNSIIRLSDRKIIPASSTMWYDDNSIIYFNPLKNGMEIDVIDVPLLFENQFLRKKIGIVPIKEKSFHALTISKFHGLNLFCQGANGDYYLYRSATTQVHQIARADFFADELFLLKKPVYSKSVLKK